MEEAIAPVLNQPQLEEALSDCCKSIPLIESISANLSTGSRVGGSVLEVQVEAQPNFQVRVGTDNSRAPSAGSLQAEVQLSASNLLARGRGTQTRL